VKGVNIPQPAGLPALLDRVGHIKARFRDPAHSFPHSLAVARAAQLTTEEVQQAIASAAERNGIEPELLRALAQVESGLRVDAVSPAGAMGITQIMPATAEQLGLRHPFDLQTNLDAGATYLREQIDRFGGDVSLALAAYNAGPAAVERHGGLPPYGETRRFVTRVLDLVATISADPR